MKIYGLKKYLLNILLIIILIDISFSERHPARSDLIVLVAHNDDPTGLYLTYIELNS